MTFARYFLERFFWRIVYFFRDWYIVAGKKYANFFFDKLEQIDRVLAWKINLTHLFMPLYKDYSLIGYIVGFVFRLGRFFVTSILYFFMFLVAVFVFFIWAIIPPYIIYRIVM